MRPFLSCLLNKRDKNQLIVRYKHRKCEKNTYSFSGQILNDHRTQHASQSAEAVRDAHQNTRISRRNVQMIYVEAADGETAEANCDRQESNGHWRRLGKRHDEQEDGLETESAAVHYLSHRRCAHVILAQMVGNVTADRHYD